MLTRVRIDTEKLREVSRLLELLKTDLEQKNLDLASV